MSVVAVSHVALVRARRALEIAYQSNDWDKVRDCDRQLGLQLNAALADDGRDARALVAELERVMGLYGRIVKALPAEAASKISPS